jgi:hypothetical protein
MTRYLVTPDQSCSCCVVPDAVLLDGVRYLEALATKSELEPLGDTAEVRYEVPVSEPAVLTNMGIPLDEVEDLLLDSAAYRQAGRVPTAVP